MQTKRILKTSVLLLTIAAAALWIFTFGNDFPIGYHPDEESKVSQVMSASQSRNWNHPLLSLEATYWSQKILPVSSDNVQDVVIRGRTVSALFGVLAVLTVVLLCGQIGGPTGMIIAAATMILCPPLLISSHYFKEDAALLAGLGLVLLGGKLYVSHSRRCRIDGLLVLGIGCGVAASAKYFGVVWIVPALLLVVLAHSGMVLQRARAGTAMLLVVIAVVGLVHLRALLSTDPNTSRVNVREKLALEIEHVTRGEREISLPIPNLYCVRQAAVQVLPHVVCAGVLALMFLYRQMGVFGCFFLAIVAYTVALMSFNAIPFARYAWPLTFLAYIGCAMTLAKVTVVYGRRVSNRWTYYGAVTALYALALTPQTIQCFHTLQGFDNDSRQQAREWVAKYLPPDATIVVDSYTALAMKGNLTRYPRQIPLPQRVRSSSFAADVYGSLDGTRAADVDYVAVCNLAFERFFAQGVHDTTGFEGLLRQRRDFYEQLFQRGELVWQSATQYSGGFVSPQILIFRLPPT